MTFVFLKGWENCNEWAWHTQNQYADNISTQREWNIEQTNNMHKLSMVINIKDSKCS